MCDTFVALPSATESGDVIFGKNSDRPQGEIQDIVTVPAHDHKPGSLLRCTYVSIPQVEHTAAVILSKPRWMWGAEMGANEHQVVIGNEAVWTTQPYRSIGLLGMDLVRLGLERGDSALDALNVITHLLDEHGQGGNCAEHGDFTYHNSFLIADPTEAWVLETAGPYWVAERITSGTRSISNALSIRTSGDRHHPDVVNDAIANGWCSGRKDFDFAAIFSEGGVEEPLSPNSREGRVRSLCQAYNGEFSIDAAMTILRDHQGNVCMHGGFETRGSQISVLSRHTSQHWFIKSPFPCQQAYERVALPQQSVV